MSKKKVKLYLIFLKKVYVYYFQQIKNGKKHKKNKVVDYQSNMDS